MKGASGGSRTGPATWLSKLRSFMIVHGARSFGVRELGPTLSIADSSGVGRLPRLVAASDR